MPTPIEIVLQIEERHDNDRILQKLARQTGLQPGEISHFEIRKASLDARSRIPVYRLRVEVFTKKDPFHPEPAILSGYQPVDDKPAALIVGAGPAGYFAALELIELGIKPIVVDRGKDVQNRRRDLRAIQQFGEVNPHSNYCFGEGGAGTYSDGKLYTRSVKRGSIQKTLRLLVEHGAKSDILYEAHPHIGSNKLPKVVQNIRETILNLGGEVHFETQVVDLILHEQAIQGIRTRNVETGQEREWSCQHLILATGHSARDIYRLLHRLKIQIESKPFALGVRVEHPQGLIDSIQYKRKDRGEHLPAASYSLVCQVQDRGVFSFCMCPGGLIVPAATAPGEIVVNGMSMSRRDSPYANSGMVSAVEHEDLQAWASHGPLAHLAFQEEVEQKMFAAGDGSQNAPALRLPDFINGRLSARLPGTSYIPGIHPAPLYELLPDFIYHRLRDGFKQFGKQMRGFYSEESVVVGTESRTSAPIRIPRDPESLQHPEIRGLFPCGEGAGYAGGIISAAMDGQRVAQALAKGI
ncbi:MAG: FAD-dependent monooxygenase [Saprospiraceae bacterium]